MYQDLPPVARAVFACPRFCVSRRAIVFLIIAALLVAATMIWIDAPLGDFLVAPKNSPTANFAKWVSRILDWPPFIGALSLSALLVRNQRASRLLWALAIGGMICGFTATTIRSTTGRARPYASPGGAQGWYGPRHDGQWLIGKAKYNSFPSGHTATVAGAAAVLLFARSRLWPLGWSLVLLVGWSRMALNDHHASDVLASMLLGLAVGAFVWRRIKPTCEQN
ncbi:MAG TPA: phosphatase PAP2 family protein [Verrucomicrobiae bacterium]|nr:phosphatase PAP2 family protein [Verrucomicrobiae bacterium]